MKRISADHYQLSSGRAFYANHGLISLSRDAEEPQGFELGEGYDGHVGDEEWTADDRRELAEYMIEEWTAFRDANITKG